jgi:uncharacterized protein with HEPN domain
MQHGGRDWRFRIEDILLSLDKIARYVAEMDYQTFRTDDKTVDAVERNLQIIGEAAANLPEWLQTRYPDVPWHQMRGLRNILVHRYFGVDLSIIWQTLQEDLPPLVPQLQHVLKQEK